MISFCVKEASKISYNFETFKKMTVTASVGDVYSVYGRVTICLRDKFEANLALDIGTLSEMVDRRHLISVCF